MALATADKIYRNKGNADIVALVDRDATHVLDVGCGAGDNAALLRRRDPHKKIYGITGSQAEQDIAADHCHECWFADLELGLPAPVLTMTFDCILFSHVLEHVRDPAALLRAASERLNPNGTCVIAVPNLANWRERLHLLQGRFDYEETGIRDATHLRFFTYDTTVPLLLPDADDRRRVEHLSATGHVPLWFLRHHFLPPSLRDSLDRWGCRWRPNFFGTQILVKIRRTS